MQTRQFSEIDLLANQLMDRLNHLDPAAAIANGFSGYAHKFADYSPLGRQQHRELCVSTLSKLESLTDRDATDRVTRSALHERLSLEIEIIDSEIVLVNNIATPAHFIRNLFDLLPQRDPSDWDRMADFLYEVPTALSGYQESLLYSAKSALAPAQRQIDAVIKQVDAYISPKGFFDQILDNYKKSPEFSQNPTGLLQRIEAGVRSAKHGYTNFKRFLTHDLSPFGRQEDAVGEKYYALMSRYFLGSTIDLQETYEWGIQELDRIVQEQQRLADQHLPEDIHDRSINALREFFTNDPERKILGTAALKKWMQELADQAVTELGEHHFDIPDPVKTIECMIAPTQEGGIYYTGPSDDFSRPGRMWWSVPAGNEEFATWIEKTTVYHEGVPGHHLQIGLATFFKDTLNDWRRHGCWVSGHGEGWALYSEELMHELGYLQDPADYLGMLDAQRLRAARVVFDIGLHLGFRQPQHYGGRIWDAENGLAFLKEHLNSSEGEIEFEWLRYLGWPGQAPSYKIGQRVWENIRDEQKRANGETFDLKNFHTKALALGSVGLDTLREALVETS